MKKLRLFETHGVVFTGSSGDEQYGLCPFTGKENKFYVNTKTWLWDSKTAGEGGSPSRFLELIAVQNQELITSVQLQRLAKHRSLPTEAFKPWTVGWDGMRYTFPVRGIDGRVQDIRTYQLGKQPISTAGCETGLLGADQLQRRQRDPVYICEGEWDAIALRWLLRKVKKPGIVLALPGASIFKEAWVSWFNGRTVHSLYDADEAGENGELLIQKRLGRIAKRLTYVHWPSKVGTDGFDVRDWIVYGAVERSTPQECYDALCQLFETKTRKTGLGGPPPTPGLNAGEVDETLEEKETEWKKPPTLTKLLDTYRKWLFLNNTDAIESVLAVLLSQQIDGSPIWLFLVSPPGGAKTEVVSAMSLVDTVYMTSSLTPHALISGANFKNMPDPSLIPRLDGRIMIVKDFTSILSMRDSDKDEIFGILRDAYDGRCGKVFGTGVERKYTSRFTIIAAVTPRIYDLSSQHGSLGERFLKFSGGPNLHHLSEREIIRRAIDNIHQETTMKWELADVTRAFIHSRMKWMRKLNLGDVPEITSDMRDRIIALGMFGARLRGTVTRDKYRHDIIVSRPSAEIGSRLGIQLAKFAKSLALVRRRQRVTEDEYRLVKKVTLDTVPQRIEDMVRCLVINCPHPDDAFTSKDMAKFTRYPLATVTRLLQDLHSLDVVTRAGSAYRHHWQLSPYIRDCIVRSGLYESEEERKRPTRLFIRIQKQTTKKS